MTINDSPRPEGSEDPGFKYVEVPDEEDVVETQGELDPEDTYVEGVDQR